MIKINLLPSEIGKKEAQKQYVKYAVIFFAVVVVVFAAHYLTNTMKLMKIQRTLVQVNKDLEKQEAVVKQVELLERQKNELAKKAGVIKQLVANSFMWAIILDEINNTIPNKIWIYNLNSSPSFGTELLTFTGTSFDNFAIANFITSLEKSRYFSKIELKYITEEILTKQGSEEKVRVLKFSLSCQTTF